jgi:hypothetical protein
MHMRRWNRRRLAALVALLGPALLAPAAWGVGGPPPGSLEAGTLTLPCGPG